MSGLSSQLAEEIREKRGLAYYMGANQRLGIDTGMFMVYAGTREDALPEVQKLMAAEMQRVTRDGISPAEFERARNQILAGHDMALQDNSALALNCVLNELYGLGYDYDFEMPSRMQALTPAKVREAAAAIIVTNREAISIVLPDKKEAQ